MKIHSKHYLAAFAALTLGVSSAHAATIVSETFDGTGADLNGTTAETFASGITAAGGSNTWVAATSFNDDGSLVGGNNQSAYLNMGSYINDAKNTATGKFTLSATLSEVSGGAFASVGFFQGNTPADGNFTEPGTDGMGTLIYRDSGELDGFAGPGSANGVDGPDGQSGDQLLTIVLDLTPGGGYDGASNFGTVTFIQGDEDTGTPLGSHTYTVDGTFGSIGLSSAGPNTNATYSNLTLAQVPEPSSLVLGSVGMTLCLLRRRRG